MNFLSLTDISNFTKGIMPDWNDGYVDWPFKNPPTYPPFSFEQFDVYASRKWFWENWYLTVYVSAFYLILTFTGRAMMKQRAPFNLRGSLAIWNSCLAIFSFLALTRTLPELLDVIRGPNGFHRSVCVRDDLNPPSAFWALMFTWSKLIELGDTAFIVLRKTPLLFLHWYHHMMTLIVCWMSYPQAEPIFRYVGCMNLFVHSLMYSWYAAKAMRFNPPRKLAMIITFLQLSQMAIGLAVNVYALSVKRYGGDCARSVENIRVQMYIYASYFLLFCNYFYKAYLGKPVNKMKRA